MVKRASGIQKRGSNKSLDVSVAPLLAELRELILTIREQVARAVNAGLTLLYWQIGQKVRAEILKEKRAEYGQQIVLTVGRQLAVEFGRGLAAVDRNMSSFALAERSVSGIVACWPGVPR